MITGTVNASLEPCVPLVLHDASGQPLTVDAMIDTGFNGFVTLSPGLIGSLGLTLLYQTRCLTADGTIQLFDVYSANVLWDGQLRTVDAQAVDAHALIGVALLQGYDLRMEVVPSGKVEIQARATP
jgi:clan AA aspartic protease